MGSHRRQAYVITVMEILKGKTAASPEDLERRNSVLTRERRLKGMNQLRKLTTGKLEKGLGILRIFVGSLYMEGFTKRVCEKGRKNVLKIPAKSRKSDKRSVDRVMHRRRRGGKKSRISS